MHPGNGDRSAWRVPSESGDSPGRLVVVSNRVADPSLGHRSGGLAVAVGEALIASGGLWFGWSGETVRDAHTRPPQVREVGDITTITMALTTEEFDGYYLEFRQPLPVAALPLPARSRRSARRH